MSEDKETQKQNNDDADDVATLKERIERLKNEKAAIEMKTSRSDDDLYSEEYLDFLQEKKKQQPPQDDFMSGGRLTNYSEDELNQLPLSKLVGLIAGEVYGRLRSESQKDMTKKEMKEHKINVAKARIEVKKFASEHSDFRNYVAEIDRLSQENPNLNIKQLYALAGGKLEEKPPEKEEEKEKEKEEKSKEAPDTKPEGEGGMKKSDKNLSLREVIAQEYQKLK